MNDLSARLASLPRDALNLKAVWFRARFLKLHASMNFLVCAIICNLCEGEGSMSRIVGRGRTTCLARICED